MEMIRADSVVMATGGQNALFGKTTGSSLCDGYAEGKLFMQGAELKNLEFIQYHPTTMETAQKKMLISEAVRGEGGRLFYEADGNRVYFMEKRFGEKGNLMPRDVVSRCMDETGRDVFLDISFLGKEEILRKLSEVYDVCLKYRGIDISKQCIPVSPSVHFFMGGIAVKNNHETNIKNLYAIGECASIYHGANRLGGNSLLAAVYSGITAAKDIYVSTDGSTCLSMLLTQVGVPVEAVGLVMGIDSFVGMFRSMSNCTGDVAISILVARLEKMLDMDKYNNVRVR